MKRDLDLIRQMLLELETATDGINRSEPSWLYHAEMLIEEDYARGPVLKDNASNSNLPLDAFLDELTSTGRGFLDAVRDEATWQRTKSELAKRDRELPLYQVKAIALAQSR